MSRKTGLAWAGILLLAFPAAAQLKLGETSNTGSGIISMGYNGDYGSAQNSDHGWALGGTASVAGSFYNPNFLSYNGTFYLNQSRANSDFQSISNASGFNLSTGIFSGSRFPGSISYSKAYNSEGNYAVPGLANYVTHGNNDSFGINWSALFSSWPTLSASFQMGNSSYSVYGANNNGSNAFHSLNLHSSYKWEGFSMGAFYNSGASHSEIPEVLLGGQGTETSQSGSSGEGFNIVHVLPLHGSVSGSYDRTTFNTHAAGYGYSGTIDQLFASAAIHPWSKVSITGSTFYSDNLSGQIAEAVASAGGAIAGLNASESSSSLDMNASAGYSPSPNVQTSLNVERRSQSFLGTNYAQDSYGASASYNHKIPTGNLNANLNVNAYQTENGGQDSLGLTANASYSGVIKNWSVNGTFGYSQNEQTLLVTYMNSYFRYSASAHRRWGKLNLGMGAGSSRTGISAIPGDVSSSESAYSSIGYGSWITASGGYNRSSGQAVVTGTGLTGVPVPPPLLPPGLLTLYGGTGYSASLSSAPVRGLTLTASYGKSNSNTTNSGTVSANDNDEFNALVQYQFRKMFFTSGYSRLGQGFGASGFPPETVSSFYVGVSRWFNFF